MRKQALVIGSGITGQSIMHFLSRTKQSFCIYDTRPEISNFSELKELFPNSEIYLNDYSTINWDKITQVLISPGICPSEPIVKFANTKNLPIKGDLQLFAEHLPKDKTVIAITGTNGKSTVTSLVGHILKSIGKRVAVAGNIGTPMLDSLLEPDVDIWVLELSSFQLHYQSDFAPTVACILNISEDHLDWHGSYQAYQKAKHKIYQYANFAVYNADMRSTQPTLTQLEAKGFSLDANSAAWGHLTQDNQITIGVLPPFKIDNPNLQGQHNLQNILAALTMLSHLEVDFSQIIQALKTFEGLPHRCQFVRNINNVNWINDSKGTNVGATLAAIGGLADNNKKGLIWIAGGQSKGADFRPLKQTVSARVKLAILMGQDKEKIASALEGAVPILFVDSMDEAVKKANANAQPGDSVLLSPACASLDMFANYIKRGEIFSNTVKRL